MARRYDSRTTTFSPEGRLYQVEYALEAVNNASATIGIVGDNCIVIAADKALSSKLLDQTTEKEKLYKLDDHMICAVAGWTADAHVLLSHARAISQRHLYAFDEPHPVELLVTRLCDVKQSYTQFGGLRPFGVSFMIAGWDKHTGLRLLHTDPAGNYRGWRAAAMGKNSAAAQTLLREKWTENLSSDDALLLATTVLMKSADSNALDATQLEYAVLSVEDGKVTQRMLEEPEIAELLKKAKSLAEEEKKNNN